MLHTMQEQAFCKCMLDSLPWSSMTLQGPVCYILLLCCNAACHALQFCTQEKMDFVSKIFNKSGIDPNMTAIPACILPVYCDEPKTDLNSAQAEAKMVYGQVITEVLRKAGEL
jgi:hypothetical protein